MVDQTKVVEQQSMSRRCLQRIVLIPLRCRKSGGRRQKEDRNERSSAAQCSLCRGQRSRQRALQLFTPRCVMMLTSTAIPVSSGLLQVLKGTVVLREMDKRVQRYVDIFIDEMGIIRL